MRQKSGNRYICYDSAQTNRRNLEEIPMMGMSESFSLSRYNPSASHGFLHLG